MKKVSLFFLFIIASLSLSFGQDTKTTTQTAPALTGEDYLVTISTELGNIIVVLYDQTPKHKENFIKLAQEGFYNGTTFHRIIDGFMIQGGDPNSKDKDPNNDGQGGTGYTIPAEFDPKLTHVYGALAAARLGDQQNPKKESSGSQFYIVENHDGTHFLDKGYTVFGQTIDGFDVIDKIAKQVKGPGDRPKSDITMTVTVKKMKKKAIASMYGYDYQPK